MTFISESIKQQIPRALLLILRIQLGVVFIMGSWSKISDLPNWPARMQGALENFFMSQSHEFYRAYLESTIIPNIDFFANAVAIGELMIGIALVLGLGTRLFALLAIFFTTNYMLMKGALPWQPSSNDAAFMGMALVLIFGAAGRAFGIDYYLAKLRPNWPLW